MTTINLYQNQQDEREKQSYKTANRGFFFSISILAITVLVLIGFKIAVSVLSKQNDAQAAVIQKEKDSMAGLNNLEQVIDMQARLQQIKNNLQIKDGQVLRPRMTQILDHMGSEVNAGIVILDYKYDNDSKKITVTIESNNFSDIARQILNFKSSEYFTNVNLIKISRGDRSIECDISMDVK